MSNGRWQARTTTSIQARFLVKLIPIILIGFMFNFFEDGFSRAEYITLAVVAVLSAGLAWWGWRVGSRTVVIALDGSTLVIGDRGRHSLSKGSLHAAQHAQSRIGGGTVVFVRLDNGEVVTVAVPSVLPDHLYAAPSSAGGELHINPDANAHTLLGMLQPYVMPRDPSADLPDVHTYSIVLEGKPRRGLYIAGNTIALGAATGEIIARAPASKVVTTAFRYAPPTRGDAPLPMCPGLMLTFVAENIELSMGAIPPDFEAHWDHLPDGPEPQYDIGYGELMKLMAVVGVARRS